MTNNNVQNIKFLRNSVVFDPSNDKTARQVALDAMEEQKANLADGTAILGRYKETDGEVKTLVGFAYISDDAKTLTVFDADVDEKINTAIEALDSNATSVDGKNIQVKVTEENGKITAVNITTDSTVNSGDVNTAITNAINKLDATDSAIPGQYVSQVSQADGKIAVSRVSLPDASSVSGASKVIIDVTQDKGAITASAANLSGVKLDGYSEAATTGDVASTDTLGEALGKLQKTIHEMDKPASAEDGKVVTTISENDGVVSEERVNVKDLQLGGYVKGEQSGEISGTDTINIALSKIENNIAASQSATTVTNTDHSINVATGATGTTIGVNINSDEKVISLGNNGIYTDIKLSAVTVSEANVKEAFALIASDGKTQLGSTIKIYNDSSLLSVALLHADYSDPQNPVLPTYDKINGWTDIASTTQANQALCFAYENVKGKVVVAAVPVGSFINEQEFASGLTWDSTAGKVIGVVDPSSESFLTVGTDGFKISGVSGFVSNAIKALDVTGDTFHSGQYITHINEENGLISIGGRADISKAPLNDYSKGSDATAVAASDTINQAISKLENQIDTAKSAATTVVAEGTDAGNNMSIAEATGNDGHKIFTVNLSDVASAQGLANEIAYRKAVDGQDGQKYVANSGKKFISSATSLNDADIKLNDALASLDTDVIKSVKVNDVKLDETSNAVNVQISSLKASGTDSSPIVVNTNDTGAVTLQILQIDCGEY